MKTLGKAMTPEFWQDVREKDCYKRFRDELLYNWKERCEQPIYSLKYTDFILYKKTGNRGVYEHTYFNHRHQLNNSALLALIYPEEEKYINFLMDIIYAVCDEYTWCLPAHQGNLDVNCNDRIDLFASETGFTLSEIYTLLGDRLEPLIRDRIRAEINRRIINPFTAKEHYGWWEGGTSNWTAVCMGSVAGAIMHMNPELAKTLIPRFNASMDKYLTGFNNDGMCLEGCGYWHYGFGFFTVYADMIRIFTDGEVDYFKLPKVKTISTFIQKMYLSGRSCVSFADGGKTLEFHLGLVHYLKDEYPDDVLAYAPKYSYNFDGCGRWCLHLRSAMWLNEEYFNNPADDTVSQECYAPDSQWFVKRTANYGFAAKGGHNAELHNHNDVGTFIFAKNGRQVIMDLGAGSYTRQYFSAERYSFLECSSRGHNVPIINGNFQGTGSQFSSKDTAYENGVFSTEFAGAYQLEGLNTINRAFSFTEDAVTLCDKFDYTGEGEIVERMVSLFKPEIVEPGKIKVEDVEISYCPHCSEAIINSEPKNAKDTCYFIDFKLNAGVNEFKATIK